MDFDLALGAPGATLPDLALRLYYGGARVTVPASVELAPVNAVDYVLSGLPELGPWRLTYEFPAGVWSTRSWGGPAAPREVVVPIREAGLSVAGLGLALTVDGAPSTAVLVAPEVGFPGDYRASGWPAPLPGERWTLRWSYWGVHGSETWRHPAREEGTRLDLDDRALVAFTALWRAAVPPPPLSVMPHVVAPGGGWKPANQEPFVEFDVLMDRGEESGPVGSKIYDLTGFLQIGVQVISGSGRGLASALLRIAADCAQRMVVQGLKVYGCRKPYDLPAPLPGYYARATDAPARYVGP